MTPHTFVKVFDLLDSGFKDWTFSAFGLIFVAIGLVMFVFPQVFKSRWKFFKHFYLGFAVLWTSVTFVSAYSGYRHHYSLLKENKCRMVEGPVENFIPMPYSGHAMESFTVSGVKFQYSDYVVTDGFNKTSSHGGPIHKDSYVRICYDPSNRQILRLEVGDI